MWKILRRLYNARLSRLSVCLLIAIVWSGLVWCAPKALDQRQIQGLVRGGVASQRIAHIVQVRGIDFRPTAAFLRTLKAEGARPVLLETVQAAGRRLWREAPQQPPAQLVPPALSPDAVRYAQQYADAEQAFNQGKQFFQQQRWPEVETEMQKAAELDPANIEAHFDLGYALSQQGKLPQAIAEYRHVLQLDPDAGTVHYDLGVALEKDRELGPAIYEYRQAVRLNPNDERAAYALGEALYERGDWPGAAVEFQAALRLVPTDADAYCALGLAQLHQRRVNDAIPELYEAVRLNPQNALAHAGLAGALLRKGDRQAALKEFQVAIALNPANSGYRADFQKLWREHYLSPPRADANP
ncbi:MAG TPA: tetratricopeptide repeat protein [Terriglobia bacterium]|nr:tetratricopeptide repeat protein [Terriglobia bacterium]